MSLAALVVASSLRVPAPPHTRAAPFIALAVVGFVLAVIGHVFRSKTAVLTGLAMLVCATVILPFGLYLSGR